jgi:phosphate transport system substrate-binding protein
MRFWPFVCFALVSTLWACGGRPDHVANIKVKGSDSEVNLVLSIAEAFMDQDSQVSLAVTGGGSGLGIAALINGKTDIANSSREITPEEMDLAKAQGIHPEAMVFATDALALAVHSSNPINELDLAQLSAIFRGKINNWKELGGKDIPISKYGRQSSSGTYVYFREKILGADFAEDVISMTGTAQLVESIKQDPSAIGYVSFGYVQPDKNGQTPGIKVLKIKANKDSIGVSPTLLANITSGRYPIVRPLFHYTNGHPKGKIKAFLQYELSQKGQTMAIAEGFAPVPPAYFSQNQKMLGQ